MILFHIPFYIILFNFALACSSAPPLKLIKSNDVLSQNQVRLGKILGPITSSKIIDRLEGYPVCDMNNETQKQTLKVKHIALDPPLPKQKKRNPGGGVSLNTVEKANPNKALKTTVLPPQRYLIEIECFFFGFQGIYEYMLLDAHQGKIYPIAFEGALKARKDLKDKENKSPVSLNQERYEVCGVPEFDKSKHTLKALCKGQSDGRCGSFALYHLELDHQTPYFKRNISRYLSCETPGRKDVNGWPSL